MSKRTARPRHFHALFPRGERLGTPNWSFASSSIFLIFCMLEPVGNKVIEEKFDFFF